MSRLAEIALRIGWRADDAMPNTARALRADAALVSLAAAIVDAAQTWRETIRSGSMVGYNNASLALLTAVDAYDGALVAEDDMA